MKRSIYIISSIIIIACFLLMSYFLLFRKTSGYVDTFRLLNEYKGIQNVKVLMEKETNNWKGKQDTLQSEFDEIVKIYEKESKTYSKSQSLDKIQMLQQKKVELERFKAAIQKELSEKEQKLTAEALIPVDELIKEYGKKHRYKFIFAATGNGNIIYANESVDLTDEILKELNNN